MTHSDCLPALAQAARAAQMQVAAATGVLADYSILNSPLYHTPVYLPYGEMRADVSCFSATVYLALPVRSKTLV